MLPLGIECIGDDPTGDAIPGLVSTADRNDRMTEWGFEKLIDTTVRV